MASKNPNPGTTPVISQQSLSSTYKDLGKDNKELEKKLENYDKLNEYLNEEYSKLVDINEQYSVLSEVFETLLEHQNESLQYHIDTKTSIDEINDAMRKDQKIYENILKYRKEEADILSGTSKIQAKINSELNDAYELSSAFKKMGSTAFAPTSLQPFLNSLNVLNQKLNVFSKDYKKRQFEIKKEYESLIESGDAQKAAAFKFMTSFQGQILASIDELSKHIVNISKYAFDKLFGYLTKIFNFFLDLSKKVGNAFLQLPEIFATVAKSAFSFQKVTMEYVKDLSQAVIAIPLNILEKANELGYEIKKEVSEFAQSLENIQKDFRGSSLIGKGLSNLQNGLISARKEFMNVNTEAVHLFGRGIQGINKALTESSEIVKSLGVFSSIFSEQIVKNKDNLFYYYKMKQTFNLADDDMQYLARQAAISGKSIATVYDSIEKGITGAAKVHKQDSKQMSKDYFDMRKNVIDFGHISDKELANVVARTRQMMVETKEASAMFQKIQTFEDAANMASQLSQGFNMVIDSMALLKAESPDQMLQMLRDAMFATGRSFNQLNRFEKSLLQQQTGLSGEAMQALFEYQNLGKSYEEVMKEMEAKDPTKLQLKAMQDLRDTVVEMKEVMPKFQNSFEAFFSGLKDNTLLSSNLRSSLEGISLSFDDIYNLGLSSSIKAFEPALISISKVISNIKSVLTGSNFISSLTSISTSISNIIENLFGFKQIDISGDIDNIINTITPMFKDLFKIGFKFIETGVGIFLKTLPSLTVTLVGEVANLFGTKGFFTTVLIPALKNMSKSLTTELKSPLYSSTLISAFKDIFSFTNEFLKIGASIAGEILKGIAKDIGGIDVASSEILTSFTSLINGILDNLIGTVNKQNRRSGGLIKNILGFDADGKFNGGNIDNMFRNIFDSFFPIMTDIARELSFIFNEVTDYLQKKLLEIANQGQLYFENLLNPTKGSWDDVFKNIGSGLEKFLGGQGIISSITRIVTSFFDYLNKSFTSDVTGGGLIDLLKKVIETIVSAYVTIYKSIYTNFIKAFISDNIGTIMKAITGLGLLIVAKMKISSALLSAELTTAGSQVSANLATQLSVNGNKVALQIGNAIIRGGNVAAQQIASAMRAGGVAGSTGDIANAIAPAGDMIDENGRVVPGAPNASMSRGQRFTAAMTGKYGITAGIAGGMLSAATSQGSALNVLGGAVSMGAMGAQLGSMFGPWGTAIGGLAGAAYGAYSSMNDGYISKDGKITKIHDNDNVIAFRENGPILNTSKEIEDLKSRNNFSQNTDVAKIINEMTQQLKESIKASLIEGFKSQNQTIEVKLNGEKVGEGLLASGFTNMMSNANKTKGNPTINPNSVIYRDGQIPSSGYIGI